MSIGVNINMENRNALVTVAMLSTYLSKENKEYLDMISPFILNLLPKNINDKINKESILKGLKLEYGFEDMPTHVLTAILKRLCRIPYNILYKKDGDFYIKNVHDSSIFEKNRIAMKNLISDVVDSLASYLSQINKTTKQDAENKLISFFEYYGFTVIKDTNKLVEITLKTDNSNYHVARFILQEYKQQSSIYSKLIEVVKGFLVYKAIYYFSLQNKKDIASKLKDTVVYLDTRLLINVLGYHTVEDTRATRELINLIVLNGGKVKTFEHNVQELAGILTKYAKDSNAREYLSLEYLNINDYDNLDAIRLRENLLINLGKKNVEVESIPEYGIVSDSDVKDKGFLELNELKVILEKSFTNSKERTIENDVDTISAISRLRKKHNSYSLDNCKAIFVTTNYLLVNIVYNLYYQERFSKGEINFLISDIDLTALLWLKSFDKKTDLPCIKLLENAYAACNPSVELVNTFISKVTKLEKEGEISEDEALIMRAQHVIDEDVVDLTENNYSKVTDELVIEVKNRILNKLATEKKIEIDNEQLIQLKHLEEENIKLQTQYTGILKTKDIEINDALEKQKQKFQENKAKKIEEIENQIQLDCKKLGGIIRIIILVIFCIIGLVGIIGTIQGAINSRISFFSLFVAILAIIQILDLLFSKYHRLNYLIKKIERFHFVYNYTKKVEELNQYYPNEI